MRERPRAGPGDPQRRRGAGDGEGREVRRGALNIHASDEVVSATKPTNFTLVRLRRDILRRSSVGGMCHQQFQETDIVTVAWMRRRAS